jgi:hypothetical protein
MDGAQVFFFSSRCTLSNDYFVPDVTGKYSPTMSPSSAFRGRDCVQEGVCARGACLFGVRDRNFTVFKSLGVCGPNPMQHTNVRMRAEDYGEQVLVTGYNERTCVWQVGKRRRVREACNKARYSYDPKSQFRH